MFERFTEGAREVVVAAQNEARALHHRWIGTEHLLLGLLADESSQTASVLRRHGLTRETVRSAVQAHTGGDGLDADALATLGIDLDTVRNTVEASFGPGALDARSHGRRRGPYDRGGHIPFSGRAKKVLELSLRECVARKDGEITEVHIMLGLIREGQGLAVKVITERGIDLEELRRQIGSQPAA
jgi:ATP-dependent Clp protease ATP-binding subunit ClpA